MPARAEGARAVLRLVEILGESWMDFANRQQIRAPSGFSRLGRVELPWGSHILAPDHAAPVLAGFRLIRRPLVLYLIICLLIRH